MVSTGSRDWPDVAALVLPGSRAARDASRAIKPGRHGLPPEEVAHIQRERLIDAFVQVVAEAGYGQTTIAKVTDAAGVTKKTFYEHFGTLEECFLVVYERGSKQLLAVMTEAFQAAPDWRCGLENALRVLLKVLAAEPPFAHVALVEVNAAGPRVRQARIAYLRTLRELFTAAAEGLPEVPDDVLDAMIGGVYTAIYLRIEAGRCAELPELLPTIVYFALLPLGGRD